MSVDTAAKPSGSVWNVPNQLSAARLALAVVMFVFLALDYYMVGLVLFVLAAVTDWFDGWWARKYNQVTVLGRILDPFADKTVVCGTFIYLAAEQLSLVAAWMAVVVVGRELLVTALRSFIEQRGGDFSAKLAGKLKMVLQCLALVLALYRLTYGVASDGGWLAEPPGWLDVSTLLLLWSAVAVTVYSGLEYIWAAVRMYGQLSSNDS